MEKKELEKAEVLNFAELVDYAEGAIVSKAIMKKETGNVTLFAFDKDEGLSEHTAPFDALVQVLDGKAEIRIDKKPYELNAGQSIIMPANIPHSLKAIEKFMMLLTMIKEV